jgi:hypothetical protein
MRLPPSRQISDAELDTALVSARAQLETAGYRGYDPFDALASPLFRLPGLRTSRLARFGAQQLVRRSPVNLRPLLRVPKGYNPVTIALSLQAYALFASAGGERREELEQRARWCVGELERLRSRGYSGACWGYDFDWESRYARMPAWTPTVVATGFVTNALFTAFALLAVEEAFELCRSATRFVLEDLNRTPGPDGSFCWSYSPLDHDAVLNATMKGARLCAQVHSVTGDSELLDAARASSRFVAAEQRESGAWPYSVGDARRWADNFHTAYVLDCLAAYGELTGETTFDEVTQRGWEYYRGHFFTDDGLAKYFDDQLYPIDATSCAQAIVTLCRFGDVAAAGRLAGWVVDNMQRPDGAFAFQVRRWYTNRTPFARWSTAWMLAALAQLRAARAEA